MKLLFVDVETYSSVDIGKCGAYKYVESDDFEILLTGYAYDNEDVQVIDMTKDKLPESFVSDMFDDSVVKIAWNAAFERTVFTKYFGRYTDPDQWFDPMILSASCGLPLALAAAGEALGLGEDQAKMKVGKDLIRYFCLPCKPTKTNGMRTRNLAEHAPDKWSTFVEYNKRDVEVERTIYKRLIKWKPDRVEQKFWSLDQRINDKGMRIDLDLANKVMDMCGKYKEGLLEEATAISGIQNPDSTKQVKDWLLEQEGIEALSLNKKVVADIVHDLKSDECKRFMELRSEFSQSSISKYDSAVRCTGNDEHIHGCFQFYGAGTGRFSGRLMQLQNLSHDTIEDLDAARTLAKTGDYEDFKSVYPNVQYVAKCLIRTLLIPEEDSRFIVADFSAIEARVIAWITGEQWRLDTFKNNGDIYCASASQAFKVPVVKHGENGHLRAKGKIIELACGFGGGIGAMKNFGADKLGMTEEEMFELVVKWRDASPHIVRFWKSIETAAVKCLKTGKHQVVNSVQPVSFDYENEVLFMTIPSGRRIAYWGAQMGQDKWGRPSLTYMTMTMKHKFERVETFGGKLTENCIAKDTLVLTDIGLVPVQNIKSSMKIWDGIEFVNHEGLIDQGYQEVINVGGLTITPSHKILTTKGWIESGKADGFDWAEVELPYCDKAIREEQKERCLMGVPMRLWERSGVRPSGCKKEEVSCEVMRMHEREVDKRFEENSRDDEPSRIWSAAFYGSKMHRTDTQGLEKLRRSWNNGVSEMVAQLRKLLGRYGGVLYERVRHRPQRQQSRLLKGKLSLGIEKSKLEKQTDEHGSHNKIWNNDSLGAIRNNRNKRKHAVLQNETRMAGRIVVCQTGCEEQVYDIRNCGKRHRFVVFDGVGFRIVSNCVQATARDVLREAMFHLDKSGYDIRGHVHDEIIMTVPNGKGSLDEAIELMCKGASWTEGLPLNADGYENDISYRKD